MPHAGTFVPRAAGRGLADAAAARPDTDWHLERLYDFLGELGATLIVATHSRYVVDLNRPPDDASLYPGQASTGLVPLETFHGEPLYRAGAEPDAGERARRLEAHWMPYHRRLAAELARVRAEHGVAVLWDAHAIASRVPRLFDGVLADFNLGTAGGASCDPELSGRLLAALGRHGEFRAVLDGRFRGGFITRRYGRPADNVHAVQMEMSEALYMEERCPWTFREDLAARARPVLREQLEIALDWAASRRRLPATP